MPSSEFDAAELGGATGMVGADPVFVLCGGRSGSTLLRFILDAHPDLACPPETSLPALCGQLAVVWALIEGAPLSPTRGDAPPVMPEGAITGIRRMLDTMLMPYLGRRGKKTFCDKSLGSARFADLLLRVYPGARFLCLYRHPMDVIASGIEACPWGLNGYGLEPYIADSPGNAVLALARYWADNAAATLSAEDSYGEHCHRVYYEDLVTSPDRVADGIFRFIGVGGLEGIEARCFTSERERFGPADFKIWHTSAINDGSVGRGTSIPVALIPPPVMDAINHLADRLGYVKVDDSWGTASLPARLRATTAEAGAEEPVPQAPFVEQHLRSSIAARGADFAARWGSCGQEVFAVVLLGAANAPAETKWLVSPGTSSVKVVASEDELDAADWTIVGSPKVWEAVLRRETNLGVALRVGDLRYCDADEPSLFVRESRIHMMAGLLGLNSWEVVQPPV